MTEEEKRLALIEALRRCADLSEPALNRRLTVDFDRLDFETSGAVEDEQTRATFVLARSFFEG
jgi:hypothetical protein